MCERVAHECIPLRRGRALSRSAGGNSIPISCCATPNASAVTASGTCVCVEASEGVVTAAPAAMAVGKDLRKRRRDCETEGMHRKYMEYPGGNFRDYGTTKGTGGIALAQLVSTPFIDPSSMKRAIRTLPQPSSLPKGWPLFAATT